MRARGWGRGEKGARKRGEGGGQGGETNGERRWREKGEEVEGKGGGRGGVNQGRRRERERWRGRVYRLRRPSSLLEGDVTEAARGASVVSNESVSHLPIHLECLSQHLRRGEGRGCVGRGGETFKGSSLQSLDPLSSIALAINLSPCLPLLPSPPPPSPPSIHSISCSCSTTFTVPSLSFVTSSQLSPQPPILLHHSSLPHVDPASLLSFFSRFTLPPQFHSSPPPLLPQSPCVTSPSPPLPALWHLAVDGPWEVRAEELSLRERTISQRGRTHLLGEGGREERR